MRAIKRITAIGSMILAGTMVLGVTGCAGEIKADGITIDSLTISGSGDDEIVQQITEQIASELSSEPTEGSSSEDVKDIPVTPELISSCNEGIGDRGYYPQVNLDTEEIREMNKDITDYVDTYIIPDYNAECWHVEYAVFEAFDGIYSIAIDFNYDGWGGDFKTYTFTVDGHVLSASEMVRLAGINESEFYEAVRQATVACLERRNDQPIINGKANPDYEFAELVEMNLSDRCINMDMPMIFYNGRLYVCQELIPFADSHETATFYSVPGGEKMEVFA